MDAVYSVSSEFNGREKLAVDLEEALTIAGLGWYNIKYSLVMAFFLIAALVECLGYSYVLQAAKCDLNLTDAQRGLISSLPFIAIVATLFFWGFLVDTRGRKKLLIYSSLAAGIFGIIAGFMPEIISYTAFKILAAICTACPASTSYTLIGEIIPQKHRDTALSITNAVQTLGSALVPALAWAIIPLDFRIDFGSYYFRSWRLLTMAYSLIFIVSAICLWFGPESPKYLILKGKHDEALDVLQTMYAGNKHKAKDLYPVKSLKMPRVPEKNIGFFTSVKIQSLPLVKPPYLKWICLNSFLLFGVFSVLNGLFIWVPDVLNRVLSGEREGSMTACHIVRLRLNETSHEYLECNDSIEHATFVINTIANVSCALIGVATSTILKFVGKKIFLTSIYLIIGISTISINFIYQQMFSAVMLNAMQLSALSIGPVNAYSVEIFPTHLSRHIWVVYHPAILGIFSFARSMLSDLTLLQLEPFSSVLMATYWGLLKRGMAVSVTMMGGRLGSVFGTNVAGLLINHSCEATFYLFGSLLLVCCALSLLLPKRR